MLYLNNRQKLFAAVAAVILILICGTVYTTWRKPAQVALAEGETALGIQNLSEPPERESNMLGPANEPEPDITVYVCGAVKEPGNVTVKKDTRLGEALELAGGALAEADLEQVNLAVKLMDEDYVYIPKKGGNLPEGQLQASKGQPAAQKGQPNLMDRPGSGKVNLNTAVQSELEKLPGVGPATAQKIIAYRQEKGVFQKPEDLMKVAGIGDKKYEQLKDWITAD